jgi:membrane fusion protein (multidrug efflux system)
MTLPYPRNETKTTMAKRIILTLLGLILIVGAIAGVKFLQIRTLIDQGGKHSMPPETVTAGPVQTMAWGSSLTATGSLEAVQGVTVAAQLPGRVEKIAFAPGAMVNKDDLLVQLDTAAEEAQLRVIQTNRDLAHTNLKRMTTLESQGLIARADFDKSQADYTGSVAQADNIRAAIAKKTIRAPFSGRLGVRLVNLGQILREGDAIVSLQVMDPVFVNFQLPQQDLAQIHAGLPITISSDTLAGKQVAGTITTISPQVAETTRSIQVQGQVANKDELLRPGMFVEVAITLPGENKVLTVPATAVLYAPYGDSLFVVEEKKGDKGGPATLTLRQQFVRLGEHRGDFVAINEGVKEGERVVTTGVFKLRNSQAVVIDNTLAPEFKLAPTPENK